MVGLPAFQTLQLGSQLSQQTGNQQILIHLAHFLIAGPVATGPHSNGHQRGRYYTPTRNGCHVAVTFIPCITASGYLVQPL